MPFVAGDSWDYCVELENPQQGAAAVEASGGCFGEAWLAMPAVMWDRQPLQLPLVVVVVVAPGPVHLVLAAVVVPLVLRPDLDDHPWDSAAVASASDAGAFAGVLLLVTRSWGSLAVVPSAPEDPVVLLAAAGDPQLLHH